MDDTKAWLAKFSDIIVAYMKNRAPDPFMNWFRHKDECDFFADDFERILVVLIDARFDQMTTAENACENTKTAVKANCLETSKPDKLPLLIPTQYTRAGRWTHLFIDALPNLHKLAKRISTQKIWNAKDLLDLMLDEMKVKYLGVKTSRLAVRWLHELVKNLSIEMATYEIPIDRLVYRVACRLDLINPHTDKYRGRGSVADDKIQHLVRKLLPGRFWYTDEPLWSTGRRAINGGHCYTRKPNCHGCIFEEICPKKYLDSDPTKIGYFTAGDQGLRKTINQVLREPKKPISTQQAEFAKFIDELHQKGIKGEEFREKRKQWQREHAHNPV